MAVSLWRSLTGSSMTEDSVQDVEFWSNPERTGWLNKQGEYIKTWRRRWFVLKQGKLFWFKESNISRYSKPRGVIPVGTCLTVKGAEDLLNKQFAFELSTSDDTMYFIADSEKEKKSGSILLVDLSFNSLDLSLIMKLLITDPRRSESDLYMDTHHFVGHAFRNLAS